MVVQHAAPHHRPCNEHVPSVIWMQVVVDAAAASHQSNSLSAQWEGCFHVHQRNRQLRRQLTNRCVKLHNPRVRRIRGTTRGVVRTWQRHQNGSTASMLNCPHVRREGVCGAGQRRCGQHIVGALHKQYDPWSDSAHELNQTRQPLGGCLARNSIVENSAARHALEGAGIGRVMRAWSMPEQREQWPVVLYTVVRGIGAPGDAVTKGDDTGLLRFRMCRPGEEWAGDQDGKSTDSHGARATRFPPMIRSAARRPIRHGGVHMDSCGSRYRSSNRVPEDTRETAHRPDQRSRCRPPCHCPSHRLTPPAQGQEVPDCTCHTGQATRPQGVF